MQTMNPILKFYIVLLAFFQKNKCSLADINRLVNLAKRLKLCWTVDSENLQIYFDAFKKDDTYWKWVEKREFIRIHAFKDLTTLKDPKAMEIFNGFKHLGPPVNSEGCANNFFVAWAKKIQERPDGSGIITLHVSDMFWFGQALNGGGRAYKKKLEEGCVIPG